MRLLRNIIFFLFSLPVFGVEGSAEFNNNQFDKNPLQESFYSTSDLNIFTGIEHTYSNQNRPDDEAKLFFNTLSLLASKKRLYRPAFCYLSIIKLYGSYLYNQDKDIKNHQLDRSVKLSLGVYAYRTGELKNDGNCMQAVNESFKEIIENKNSDGSELSRAHSILAAAYAIFLENFENFQSQENRQLIDNS